jgi:hypothetical protein
MGAALVLILIAIIWAGIKMLARLFRNPTPKGQ